MRWTVDAPGGDVSLALELDDGRLRYTASRRTVEVVTGDLGLTLDDAGLASALTFDDTTERPVTSSFSLPHGKARTVSAEGNELRVSLRSGSGATLVVVARAYDDGVAFRYELPDGGRRAFVSEATTFEFADEGRAWIQPTDLPGYTGPAYEAVHANGVSIGHTGAEPSWNVPALFDVGDTFVLLAESDTDETFFAGHLEPIEGRPAYRLIAPQAAEGEGVGDRLPAHEGPWTLPWRVLAIGDLATVTE